MRCPFCKRDDSKVLDSRESAEGTVTRRRRECLGCHKRFTTYERVEELMPLVVKKDGRREPYDREKLISGLQKAVEKRPVSMEQLELLVAEVESRIVERGEKEVPSS
ncbi:MAG: transcriptional regulator NrdR, partial [Myxococcaceae bacterium]